MASSLLSPTSSLQLFAKRPHISTFKTRNHDHKVYCNDSRNADVKLDRRNLLVGIGGLYGATNLDSPAMAAPITAPDFTKCTQATDLNTQQPFQDNCCPPLPGDIVDHKLESGVLVKRLRPAGHKVTQEYIDKFELAVARMKALPKDDPRNYYQQANVHCAYCNLAYEQTGDSSKKLQIHHCWHFFPWHRWYLYFYERILGNLIDDPTFGLPFWNWDNRPPALYIPEMYYKKETSSLYNSRRNPCHLTSMPDLKWHSDPSNPAVRPDLILDSNLTEMKTEMSTTTLEEFYGKKYVVGTDPSPGMGAVERGSHNALHIWVGQDDMEGFDLGNFATAGRDLIFFAHHANLDRLWAYWKEADTPYPKEFSDSDWLDSDYLFYDENANLVRVKVKDCLDHRRLGYYYQEVHNPWANYKPKANKKKSDAAAKAGEAIVAPVFPVKLKKVVRAVVNRPKGKRSKEEKAKEEELLVIEGIEVDTSGAVRFEVYVNDEDDKPGELVDKAEYAGCFSLVPHANTGSMKSSIRLPLTGLLEELEVEGDDKILVSLVPRAGGKKITVGGIKIEYVNYLSQ